MMLQFRRRNKRRMEMPSAPHPELTAEQKQHISDRSSALASSGQLTGQLLGRRMMGAGHSRPGGSVAERVLMFEKSPSAFGVEPVQVGSDPIRLEFKNKMYNIFSLRAGAGAAAEGAAAIGDGHHALEAEPGDGQQQGPGAAAGDNPVSWHRHLSKQPRHDVQQCTLHPTIRPCCVEMFSQAQPQYPHEWCVE